jgi:hypothetical protein
MKKTILIAVVSALTLGVNAGDWGKAPAPAKAPIEECVDIGATITTAWHSDYIYKGMRLGRDSVETGITYGIDALPIPLTLGVNYKNVIGGGGLSPFVDDLALSLSTDIGTVAGFDLGLSYTQHYYPEINNTIAAAPIGPDSNGEIALSASRDLGIATFNALVAYNLNAPSSWNLLSLNGDTGAWYYDLGLSKSVALGGLDLVLSGGVAISDNYYGRNNVLQSAHSSGWSHYYLTAALPIELNCRATLTPYIGYTGAPDGWLMDGAINPDGLGQSDILHGGVTLSVSF